MFPLCCCGHTYDICLLLGSDPPAAVLVDAPPPASDNVVSPQLLASAQAAAVQEVALQQLVPPAVPLLQPMPGESAVGIVDSARAVLAAPPIVPPLSAALTSSALAHELVPALDGPKTEKATMVPANVPTLTVPVQIAAPSSDLSQQQAGLAGKVTAVVEPAVVKSIVPRALEETVKALEVVPTQVWRKEGMTFVCARLSV